MTSPTDHELFRSVLDADAAELNALWQAILEALDELEAEQEALTKRRSELEARREVLRGIATLRKLARGEDEDSTPTLPPAGVGPAAGENTPTTTPREAIREILDAEPERDFDARTLQGMLDERGIRTTRDNTRVALQRLTRTGGARRVGHGRYRSRHSSASESLLGPQQGDDSAVSGAASAVETHHSANGVSGRAQAEASGSTAT
jgi:hypothetical protein